MGLLKPPVRWLESYWDEEDVWFYFEADEDGCVLRQVELSGPTRAPIMAASLAEWPDADSDGIDAVRRYESKYGSTAEVPLKDSDDVEYGEIERAEFLTLPAARAKMKITQQPFLDRLGSILEGYPAMA